MTVTRDVDPVIDISLDLDAADRLILDEAATLLRDEVVVIGESALAFGALAGGASRVRVHQDSAVAERALLLREDDRLVSGALDSELLAGAELVLLRLPKSLDALDDIARSIAAFASPTVVVVAGGRLKYMTTAMNEVLLRSFGSLDVSRARQKSRVLIAREPARVHPASPRIERLADIELLVGAAGGVFAGATLDIGTRALLDTFDGLPEYVTAIDLGCGTGILAAQLKRRRPTARVIATDASAVAVASARATALANGLDVEVVREAGLSGQADASADLIVLNPPFHDGGAITTAIAHQLFAEAARVLRPGGELWTVWNSHLGYRSALARIVGPTREISRTAKFTVTASRTASGRPELFHG